MFNKVQLGHFDQELREHFQNKVCQTARLCWNHIVFEMLIMLWRSDVTGTTRQLTTNAIAYTTEIQLGQYQALPKIPAELEAK